MSLGIIDLPSFWSGLTAPGQINPLEILALFFSMAFISIVLDEVGFFEWLAYKVVTKAKASQYVLFFLLYFLVSVLTVFTSNDIIIITLTPFIIFFSKSAKIDPIPYLVSEFVAANTWSMLFIIGNPTNIYLASSFNISFISYLEVMYLPTILAGVTSLIIMFLLFRKSLRTPLSIQIEEAKIKDQFLFKVSLSLLGVCILLMAIASFINLPMWMIASISCLVLLTVILGYIIFNHPAETVVKKTFKRLPYPVVPFILSMFVFVLAFNSIGISDKVSSFLNSFNNPIWVYGLSSYISANLINNIPMSVFFSSVLAYQEGLGGVYATIISSNLAAFLTPIGALAGIMWMSILKDKNIKLSFGKFTLYGLVISLPCLVTALLGLMVTING